MTSFRSKFATFFLCVGLACAVPQLLARKNEKDHAASGASDQRRAMQALNRLTFGARVGDVQQVMAMGVEKWIDLQLHPEKIDDSALNSRLAPLATLRMSTKEIAEDFPNPQLLNQVMNGRRSMPSDPIRRAIYKVQLARFQDRKNEAGKNASIVAADRPGNTASERSAMTANTAQESAGANAQNTGMTAAASDTTPSAGIDASADMNASGNENMMAASAPPAAPVKMTPEEEAQARRREDQLYADLEVQQLPSLPPDQRFKKILDMPTASQVAFAESLRGGKGLAFLEGLSPKQRETLLAMNNPLGVVTNELAQAKLLRAVYSQRQLDEVMTDFWVNHFNVFIDKGLDRLLVTSYERDVIRPRALGKFEDLLVATAKSPAMLFYLDNWLSVGPNSVRAVGPPPRPYGRYGRRYPPQQPQRNQGRRPSGLNENYGRELLELHTLSVNGGYSQRDVTEVAKVFTGWTIDKPAEGGEFKYEPRMHEPGSKLVLGHRIKSKGEGEGLEVLHLLATNPQTAHFISLKLAERFVSDNPPPALVDRMAKTFLNKKGDIREVLSTLFHSPEFWDDGTYRAKVKTPFEFVASALRATGAEVEDALPLTRQLANMGMPLYGAQPPSGYSMKAETWVSSSALLNRMNFALALTGGKMRGVKVDAAHLDGSAVAGNPAPTGASETLSTLEGELVAGGVSQQTHDSIVTQVQTSEKSSAHSPDVSMIGGLLLGSPEFQRR
ncbi:MAG: hypothetical protein JWQ87_2428 [Candidatus Sulfotelmatobacter sp.]|nr:hypothetical protein [Candidatus Sulfotelmatobacter sp.]